MDWVSLKYWHWIVLGVLVGGLIGYAWSDPEPPQLRSGDVNQFKARVGQTSTSELNNGRPLIYDIVVLAPQTDPNQTVIYPVTYKLLGTDKARKSAVYEEQSLYAKAAFDGKDTVVQFLRNKNVSFSDRTGTGKYLPVGYGVAGGVLCVGLIWPTMIRLMVGAGFAAPKPVQERRYASGEQDDGTVKAKKRGLGGLFGGGGGSTADPLAPQPIDPGGSIDGLFASGSTSRVREATPAPTVADEKKEYGGVYYPVAKPVVKKDESPH